MCPFVHRINYACHCPTSLAAGDRYGILEVSSILSPSYFAAHGSISFGVDLKQKLRLVYRFFIHLERNFKKNEVEESRLSPEWRKSSSLICWKSPASHFTICISPACWRLATRDIIHHGFGDLFNRSQLHQSQLFITSCLACFLQWFLKVKLGRVHGNLF